MKRQIKNSPCDRTMQQINDVIVKQLDGHCLSQVQLEDDGMLEFWSINGHVVITHTYPGRNGWTHYLPSKTHHLDGIAEEISDWLY